MATIVDEIREKVEHLADDQQRQVLNYINQLNVERNTAAREALIDFIAFARQTQAEQRTKYGDEYSFNSVDVLNEIREERLNDIMGDR